MNKLQLGSHIGERAFLPLESWLCFLRMISHCILLYNYSRDKWISYWIWEISLIFNQYGTISKTPTAPHHQETHRENVSHWLIWRKENPSYSIWCLFFSLYWKIEKYYWTQSFSKSKSTKKKSKQAFWALILHGFAAPVGVLHTFLKKHSAHWQSKQYCTGLLPFSCCLWVKKIDYIFVDRVGERHVQRC